MPSEKSTELAVIKPQKPPANLKALSSELMRAKTPDDVLDFERKVAAYEAYMRRAGFSQGDLHEINEHRMRARWRLGQMLAAVERGKAGRKGNTSQAGKYFTDLIKRLNLDKNRAVEAQRIGKLPKLELEKIFREARTGGELVTIGWLVDAGRPYWYKANRERRHRDIRQKAAEQQVEQQAAGKIGPFPLIYADPPWKFDVYSEKGLERTPDQHYPTMTDEEIIAFEVCGTSIDDLAAADAALLMWCTSSNIKRAVRVMEGWGFEYKSQAIWVKALRPEDGATLQRQGMGLVFRNMHEVLLYGTRGNMPGPQYQPPSVFFYPRGRHSAKPPEIRLEIEKMYPDFDRSTRCELFCRDQPNGWWAFGFEAGDAAQAAE